MSENDTKRRKRKGERKDKRVQLTLTIGRDEFGERIRKSFYGATRSEAARQREEYKHAMKAGLILNARKMTVSEWVDTWNKVYGSDTDDYATYIKRVKKSIGNMQLWDVQEVHLVNALKAYSGKSKSAAMKYRMVLKQIFSRARKNRIIPFDPSEDLKLPSNVTEGSHRALERWESDCIIANWSAYRAGLWAMLMLLCGLRRGEMVALDWDAIDLDKRAITVKAAARMRGKKTTIKNRTKTVAGMRTLPICEPLYEALCATPSEKRNGPVCTRANGSRITQSAMDRGWETYCNAMTRIINGEPPLQQGRRRDLEKPIKDDTNDNTEDEKRTVFLCTPHDLRHTYATALYDAGVDVKSAQYYLGHDDIRMTIELYTHLSKERENKSRVNIVDYLDKWLKTGEEGAK